MPADPPGPNDRHQTGHENRPQGSHVISRLRGPVTPRPYPNRGRYLHHREGPWPEQRPPILETEAAGSRRSAGKPSADHGILIARGIDVGQRPKEHGRPFSCTQPGGIGGHGVHPADAGLVRRARVGDRPSKGRAENNSGSAAQQPYASHESPMAVRGTYPGRVVAHA